MLNKTKLEIHRSPSAKKRNTIRRIRWIKQLLRPLRRWRNLIRASACTKSLWLYSLTMTPSQSKCSLRWITLTKRLIKQNNQSQNYRQKAVSKASNSNQKRDFKIVETPQATPWSSRLRIYLTQSTKTVAITLQTVLWLFKILKRKIHRSCSCSIISRLRKTLKMVQVTSHRALDLRRVWRETSSPTNPRSSPCMKNLLTNQ